MLGAHHRWGRTQAAAIFLIAAVSVSVLSSDYQVANLTADPYAAPIAPERAERCRAALAETDWPGPDTAHTFKVGWTLLRGLLLVDQAWPGHCAVLSVHQDETRRVDRVIVHAATGGDAHKRALVRVTTHNQGLSAPATAAESEHIFSLRWWAYAPDY